MGILAIILKKKRGLLLKRQQPEELDGELLVNEDGDFIVTNEDGQRITINE